MNVSAASRMPAPAVRTAAPSTSEADEASDVGGDVDADAPTKRGGSDTPFTHALHQGNGKKLGILKRMPAPEDVAAEQVAAGLDPTAGEAAAVADAPAAEVDPGAVTDLTVATERQAPTESVALPDDTIHLDGGALSLSVLDRFASTDRFLSEALASL